MEGRKSSNPYTLGNTAQEEGLSHVPYRHMVPPTQRPRQEPETASIPVIDMARLRQEADERASVIEQIGTACRRLGFFQVVNHGICQSVLEGALSTANDFFQLPDSEKAKFMASDVHQPVRYATSIKDGVDNVQFWRMFFKHYAYPLHQWINSWPTNPPLYRENMGKYCTEVRKLTLELMGAITESLGLGTAYVRTKMEDGMQVMAINCYPPCPNPDTTLGLPPHSDYSCLTIVLQNSVGLEIKDQEDGNWKLVPELKGALQVHVGDHLEVLSNGIYKSVVHRATLNSERTRISIASLQSLGMDEKMGVAKELVDDQHPEGYKKSSFLDFLYFLSENDIVEERFINTLKINDQMGLPDSSVLQE